MLKDRLLIAEAVVAGALMFPLAWALRVLLRQDTGAVMLHWGGFAACLALVAVLALLPRQHRGVTGATALVMAGGVWGTGVTGTGRLFVPGDLWDIQVLWYRITGEIGAGTLVWQSIAWLSGAGLITFLIGAVLLAVCLERPLKEMRAVNEHRGTNRYRSRETVFGDARWGTWSKIKHLIGDEAGLVFGEDYDPRQNPKAFNPSDPGTWGRGGKADLVTMRTGFAGGHSLVFGGTGEGKTAGIVFPTALRYRHPIIVMDPQGEIHDTVAQARASMGFQGRVIEPGYGLDLISFLRPALTGSERGSERGYAHIADTLVGRKEALKSEYSQFFAAEGAALVSGLLEHLVTSGAEEVFSNLYGLLSQPETVFKQYIKDLRQNPNVPLPLRTRLASYAEMEPKTFSNLQTNVKQALNWAAFPKLCKMLDTEPRYVPPPLGPTTDIYIRLGLGDLASYPGLARAILGALLYVIAETGDGIERLMIVDEAYQVGRLRGFELIRDTMRKRGLHLMLIFQSVGQIREVYGEDGVRAWNASVAARVFGTTEDERDAASLSRMIGDYTVDVEGRSKSSGIRGLGIGTPSANASRNINLQKAPLIRPEQLRTLPGDASIILFKGQSPLFCGKALAWRRAEFQHATPYDPAHRPQAREQTATYRDPPVAGNSAPVDPDTGEVKQGMGDEHEPDTQPGAESRPDGEDGEDAPEDKTAGDEAGDKTAGDKTGGATGAEADDRPDGAQADGARANGIRADGVRADGARADGDPPGESSDDLPEDPPPERG